MCDCAESMNEYLKTRKPGVRLSQAFGLSGTIPNLIIATDKLYKQERGSPVKVFASYCPFCGKPYKEPKPEEGEG